MRIVTTLGMGLLVGAMSTAAFAQEKKEEEKVDCLDVASKHVRAIGGTLREQKPSGRCALAKWAVQRHEELLRSFNTESEECRNTELGKNIDKTLKHRIREEARDRKRYCKGK
jgi:hypothetical protein